MESAEVQQATAATVTEMGAINPPAQQLGSPTAPK
jgi:hypothetical protein